MQSERFVDSKNQQLGVATINLERSGDRPIGSRLSWLPFLLVVSAALGNKPLAAQNGNNSSSGSSTASANSSSQAASPPPSTFTGPLADYVPCMFREEDQFSMRAEPYKKYLSAHEADHLYNTADTAIQQALVPFVTHNPTFVTSIEASFHASLYGTWLTGLTFDEALDKIRGVMILGVMSSYNTLQQKNEQLRSTEDIAKSKLDASQDISKAVSEAVEAKIKAQLAPTPEDLQAAGYNGILSLGSKYSAEYLLKIAQQYNEYLNKRSFAPGNPASFGKIAADFVIASKDDPAPYSQSASQNPDVLDKLLASLSKITEDVVNEAKDQSKKFQPPGDISCSMAIMSWKETRDVFGRRVANTFVGIQVNLRNLNTKNEFLIHDIQVAVDTGMDADHFGRFQSGRDKLLVRAVAQKGQSDDRRNIVANVLQSVGSIAASSSLVAGTQELKDAVAVFQGAFIPGFQNIFPDHTVDHLNHISDLVFSASNTNKVLVPIQGSVPLVTFISEKPLEELPYAWCGHEKHKWFDFTNLGREQNCDFNGGGHDPGYVTPYRYHGRRQEPEQNSQPPVSEPTLSEEEKKQLDQSQQQLTLNGMKEQYDKDKKDALKSANPPFYPQGPTVAQPKDSNNNETAFKDGLPPWKDLAFRDWAGAAVRMLQEHAYVVISGVHIQEVVTQPRFSNLTCPQFKSGQMDLSQTNNSNVECTVNGVGLNLVTGATLQRSGSTLKSSTFKPSNDGNSATIAFKPEDLCAGDGDYSLFVTYKSDTQKDASPIDSGSKVQMTPQPVLTDKPTLAGGTLTLKGACLDTMKAVTLKGAGSPTVSLKEVKDATTDSKTRTASVTAGTGSKLSGDYTITYSTKLVDSISPSPTVTVTQGADSSNANNAAAPADTTNPAPSPVNAAPAKGKKSTPVNGSTNR